MGSPSPERARRQLVWLLQAAHAGELAATHAYAGHLRAVTDPEERTHLARIRQEEIDHRTCVRALLTELEASPLAWREALFWTIGVVIGLLCRLGSWFGPLGYYAAMHGAGRLEAGNVDEYLVAARHAREAGVPEMVPRLHHMAVVEWEHEVYFYERCQAHWLHRYVPGWRRPAEPSPLERA